MSDAPKRGNSRRRGKKQAEPSEQEKQLHELVFGKDIVAATSERQQASVQHTVDKRSAPTAAWEDDEDIEVDLSSTNRLKKLRKGENQEEVDANSKVTGGQYTQLLQERFKTRELDWANTSSSAHEDEEDDPENYLLLNQTGTMVEGSKGKKGGSSDNKGGPLQQGRIDILRLVDANAAEPSKEPVSAVKFHPSGRLLMASSEDKSLRFFQIDGDKNEKILSVKFNDMSISCAAFLGRGFGSRKGAEVVVSGRKPYFYSYDTASGAVTKIPGLMGKGLKSHETMAVSPLGTRIAFAGAGGYIHIVCGTLKTWQMDLKMNTACRAICFMDEETLTTSGLDADVYVWDLRHTGRCINRFPHDDGTCTSALGLLSLNESSDSNNVGYGYLAVGAESGVVTVFKGDLRSRYRGVGIDSGLSAAGIARQSKSNVPTAMKSVMNLTTKVDSIAFHSSGELLAIASSQKKDQLKLVHLPSCTVFSNWPTERTPIRKVTALDFSPGGGYLAVGNNRGRVLLYRLNHFDTA